MPTILPLAQPHDRGPLAEGRHRQDDDGPHARGRAAAGRASTCSPVDLDPQGNLSDYFDVDPDATPTIGEVLAGRARAVDAIHKNMIPANLGLAEAELVLSGKMGRELTLKRALRESRRQHDADPDRLPAGARPADGERARRRDATRSSARRASTSRCRASSRCSR